MQSGVETVTNCNRFKLLTKLQRKAEEERNLG